MSSTDLSKNSLSNKIAERITQQIITGELKPGEKLVEYAYAEEYGTSRAPVREALYLLTIEGLVERIPRKGAVVKSYTEAEIIDLLEIRIMLESLAMKRILERGVDFSIVEKMEELLKVMEAEKNYENYTKLNHAFHMCLIEMSKSEIIKSMYVRMELPLLSIQSMSFASEGNIDKSVREHGVIVDLLRDNKITEAINILNKHNEYVIISMQKLLKTNTNELKA
ncbi:GntR family transcriptional regulator [Alkalihalobacillus deserti]|uniref:GntR family transcriptional regulator n=1 Tax=Alkalihalobacillus deserti TaxID=2879466 RepID=UPI001D13FD4C|nr:GntR family transcriptional regulator [Alkalihalobacillus deserti]